MKLRHGRAMLCGVMAGMLALANLSAHAQANGYERAFPQSKAAVEAALKNLQANLAGRLPVLEGFAKSGQHSLDRYQRGYYQATVSVSAAPGGGSLVRVRMEVTAWYNDPAAAHSGYQLLVSNGRLEADLLDQLGDQLASANPARGGATDATASNVGSSSRAAVSPTTSQPTGSQSAASQSNTSPVAETANSEPTISAPAPRFPGTDQTFSTSISHGLAAAGGAGGGKPEANDAIPIALRAETESLEQILKNQARPKNLVAVKKSGTPVVGSPSLTAKTLFLASMHDEFEMLNFNADWVHVRISGLSRGWIWRDSVEMPEGIPDTEAAPAAGQATAADLFHVIREENAQFPGDWDPLRGKNVKIVTVQKIDESVKDAGPKERLAYVKFLFEKNYAEVAQKSYS